MYPWNTHRNSLHAAIVMYYHQPKIPSPSQQYPFHISCNIHSAEHIGIIYKLIISKAALNSSHIKFHSNTCIRVPKRGQYFLILVPNCKIILLLPQYCLTISLSTSQSFYRSLKFYIFPSEMNVGS